MVFYIQSFYDYQVYLTRLRVQSFLTSTEYLPECIQEEILSFIVCPHCNVEYDEEQSCFCWFIRSINSDFIIVADNIIFVVRANGPTEITLIE